MSINGVGETTCYLAGYGAVQLKEHRTESNITRDDLIAVIEKSKSGNNFSEKMGNVVQANEGNSQVTLHSNDEVAGDIAISSWADVVNGTSVTVYKTKDFDPENPVYKVKTWDKAGNVTERMVDVSKVDPKNCDTIEMYAYTSYLKDSGKGDFKETVLKAAIAKAAKNAEQRSYASWDFSEKIDWVATVKDIMQSAYSYGDFKGYLEWKKFLGFLE